MFLLKASKLKPLSQDNIGFSRGIGWLPFWILHGYLLDTTCRKAFTSLCSTLERQNPKICSRTILLYKCIQNLLFILKQNRICILFIQSMFYTNVEQNLYIFIRLLYNTLELKFIKSIHLYTFYTNSTKMSYCDVSSSYLSVGY